MGFKKIVFALPLAALLSLPVVTRAEEPDPAAQQGKIDSLDDRVLAVESDVSGLKKVKISGYVQARYEASENSKDQYKVDANKSVSSYLNKDYFYIRRGRVKVTWEPTSLTTFLIQIDAAKNTITLKDAEGSINFPIANKYSVGLKMGQFKWPFSYDVNRSSSDREMPERALSTQNLMPGERDRGVQFQATYKGLVDFRTGLFSGSGIQNSTFPVIPPTSKPTWVSRLALDFGWVSLAGSSFVGPAGFTLPADANSTNKILRRDRNRFGADAQFYYELPYLGGGRLMAEMISGKDFSQSLKSGNGGYAKSLGFQATLVQNFLDKEQFAFRYDFWDPDTGVDYNRVVTYGLALIHNFDGSAKLTLAYEIPKNEVKAPAKDPVDNKTTIQFQYKF
ncbi:MAG: porin [Proteobacteria bacterium]|nr:porin [Pseudomonadota bacterium]